MIQKSLLQTARQFWHRHDLGVNATLGLSAVVGAYAGFKVTENADLGNVPATLALKAGSTMLGAGSASLMTATCVAYPPMALVPLGLGVMSGLEASNSFKAQQQPTNPKEHSSSRER